MRRRTFWTALATLALLAPAACDSPTGSTEPVPARLDIVSGDLQTATVNTELAQPLVVKVLDDKGHAVKGQIVNFRVTAGNGSVFAGSAITDQNGEARERWTLGTVAADSQKVEARAVDPVSGAALVFATFRAVATAAAPSSIGPAGASAFTGLPLLALADSVAAVVRDVYGNPVPGAAVVWTVKQGGGSVSPATSTTGSTGVARASWTLGAQLDSLQVIEAAAGLTLKTQFTANGRVPSDAVIVKVSGDAQADTVAQTLPQPLVVRVQRANGTPIAGIPVTFTLPAGSGSVSPATGVTNAAGQVSVQWTLGTVAGSPVATASISTGSSVVFGATALSGAPDRIEVRTTGGALVRLTEASVLDAYGNGVPGVQVTFTPNPGNGSVSPTSATTSGAGIAETQWTLAPTEGPQTLTVAGAGLTATCTYTIPAGQLDLTVTRTSGDGQHGFAGQTPAQPLVVRVTRGGVSAEGVTVTWKLSATGSADSTAATTTTAADGRSSLGLKLPARPGIWTVKAIVPGDTTTFTAIVDEFIVPDTMLFTAVGQTAVLRAYAGGPGGTPATGVAWSSADPSVATVDADGTVHAVARGLTTVRGSVGDAVDSAHVYVALPMSADSVSVGGGGGCALVSGSVYCWGRTALARPPYFLTLLPWPAAGTGYSSISVGGNDGCAIKAGQAYCWGGLALAQGGSPGTPYPVPGHAFTQARVGAQHICAIDAGQRAWCWGRGDFGMLGTGDTLNRVQPDSVRGGHAFTQVAPGSSHTCALKADGTAWCWGLSFAGEIGAPAPEQCRPGTGCSTVPVAVQGGLHFTTIATGLTYTCALDTTGKAWCWGSAQFGVLAASTATPTAVPGGLTFTSLTAGDYHACGVTPSGAAYCWGWGFEGRLGNGSGDNVQHPTPVPVSGGLSFRSLEAGQSGTCGVAVDGALYCWGTTQPVGLPRADITVPTRAISTF